MAERVRGAVVIQTTSERDEPGPTRYLERLDASGEQADVFRNMRGKWLKKD